MVNFTPPSELSKIQTTFSDDSLIVISIYNSNTRKYESTCSVKYSDFIKHFVHAENGDSNDDHLKISRSITISSVDNDKNKIKITLKDKDGNTIAETNEYSFGVGSVVKSAKYENKHLTIEFDEGIDPIDIDMEELVSDLQHKLDAVNGITISDDYKIGHSNSVTPTQEDTDLYKIAHDAQGHITDSVPVTKNDITALGIPGQDTTYSAGAGLTLEGTQIRHSGSIQAQQTAVFKKIAYNGTGHITAISDVTYGDMPSELQTKISTLESNKVDKSTTVNNKNLGSNITLDGRDIKLTGYEKPSSTGDISANDTLNAAIGKFEKQLEKYKDFTKYSKHRINGTTHTINDNKVKLASFEYSTLNNNNVHTTFDLYIMGTTWYGHYKIKLDCRWTNGNTIVYTGFEIIDKNDLQLVSKFKIDENLKYTIQYKPTSSTITDSTNKVYIDIWWNAPIPDDKYYCLYLIPDHTFYKACGEELDITETNTWTYYQSVFGTQSTNCYNNYKDINGDDFVADGTNNILVSLVDHSKLNVAGGTMNGAINFSDKPLLTNALIRRTTTDKSIWICGGTNNSTSGSLYLGGADRNITNNKYNGSFILTTPYNKWLGGYGDSLVWNGMQVRTGHWNYPCYSRSGLKIKYVNIDDSIFNDGMEIPVWFVYTNDYPQQDEQVYDYLKHPKLRVLHCAEIRSDSRYIKDPNDPNHYVYNENGNYLKINGCFYEIPERLVQNCTRYIKNGNTYEENSQGNYLKYNDYYYEIPSGATINPLYSAKICKRYKYADNQANIRDDNTFLPLNFEDLNGYTPNQVGYTLQQDKLYLDIFQIYPILYQDSNNSGIVENYNGVQVRLSSATVLDSKNRTQLSKIVIFKLYNDAAYIINKPFMIGNGLNIDGDGTTIRHSTDSGYKHIPSGGYWGSFLTWDSGGTAKWSNDIRSIEFTGFIGSENPKMNPHGGFIDFHYATSTDDYTTRIVEYEHGVLTIAGRNTSGVEVGGTIRTSKNPSNDNDLTRKGYVDQRVLRTGDTMSGPLIFTTGQGPNYPHISRSTDVSYIRINGGTKENHGAQLLLFGSQYTQSGTVTGSKFKLSTGSEDCLTDGCYLYGDNTGKLTWWGGSGSAKNIVRSVKIDGIDKNTLVDGSVTINSYGTCSTAAATAAKTVSITSGTPNLEAGLKITVKFTNANTASTPTLNVNSTGAKNIFHKGSQITTRNNKSLLAGTCEFVYDGTQWHLVGNYIDTVYTHPTTAGNKHIPSGGSSGQILRWSADGTAIWGSVGVTIPDYENMRTAQLTWYPTNLGQPSTCYLYGNPIKQYYIATRPELAYVQVGIYTSIITVYLLPKDSDTPIEISKGLVNTQASYYSITPVFLNPGDALYAYTNNYHYYSDNYAKIISFGLKQIDINETYTPPVITYSVIISYSGNANQTRSATISSNGKIVYESTSGYASHSQGGSSLKITRSGSDTVIASAGRGGSFSGEYNVSSGDVVTYSCADGKGSGYSSYNFKCYFIPNS